MNSRVAFVAAVTLALAAVTPACAQNDVAVPATCTRAVNATLAKLLSAQGHVDNVMVCGTAISSSRTQYGGAHGDHQIIPLRVLFPDGTAQLVEVVTNDALDGRVTARAGASVFAYGQAFLPGNRPFAAGLHDVHCSTHRGADNGWVVVDGVRNPARCPS
jgi:hypothetical protein